MNGNASRTTEGPALLFWGSEQKSVNVILTLTELPDGRLHGHGTIGCLWPQDLQAAFEAGEQELILPDGVRYPIVMDEVERHSAKFRCLFSGMELF